MKKRIRILFKIYRRKRGFAIINLTMLMVITSVAVVMISFNTAFKEYASVKYLANYTRAQYLAQSGLEAAQMLLRQVPEKMLYQFGILTHPPPVPLGGGIVTFEIEEVSGRINLNTLVNVELDDSENLQTRGRLDRLAEKLHLSNTIWDGVTDWVDANSQSMPKGAEKEDYAALTPPRRIKNGRLHSIEELMMVVGFNYNILYKDLRTEEEKENMEERANQSEEEEIILTEADYILTNNITVYSPFAVTKLKININSAPYHVIFSLSESLSYKHVRDILIARLKNGGRFDKLTDLQQITSLNEPSIYDGKTIYEDISGLIVVNDQLYKIVASSSFRTQTAHVMGIYDKNARRLTYYMD